MMSGLSDSLLATGLDSPGESAGRHVLRPGATLVWGSGLELGLSPGEILLFVFALGSGLEPEGMILSRTALKTVAAFRVAILLSLDALRDLLLGDQTAGGERILRFATEPAGAPIILPSTPATRLAVESIRSCPFVGACRNMALAARANDLLFEFFTTLTAATSPPRPTIGRTVRAQVQAAGALLDRHLDDPPALAALARQVGLSETSLKRGFHLVFGTTVFGYLRARRMERARTLLASGEVTVLEAAALVGYSNPSNFAAAFRRQFGINPKEFQLTARRQE